ncbi:VanZ family protein [Sporosarcina sp. E16_8]|uniref:VanZ family protein n=1 Tax=Sporosarcina sp. E16_8 TaxID=2789295 RepID=UPI001A91E1D4|nr:VanZ family protein [Sporosarcina sp. E16_8]MBO0587222.1 VanZ family protein [Sporosarcina sp. E16_8]
MGINIITLIGLTGLLIYIIVDFVKRRFSSMLRRLVFYSFIFYLITVITLTTGRIIIPPIADGSLRMQLIPFYFLWDLLNFDVGDWFFWNSVKLSFNNLIMLFPLGVYLSLLFNIKGMKKAAFLIFLSSLSIESSQLIFSSVGFLWGRTFNVDDLLLNTLGGVLGFMVFEFMKKMFTSRSIDGNGKSKNF